MIVPFIGNFDDFDDFEDRLDWGLGDIDFWKKYLVGLF